MIHNHVSPRARRRAAKWRLTGLIKLNSGCVDCGYNLYAEALQFDHINDNKHMNVSDMIRSDYSWVTIKQEIDKCEVVCANCHAIRTSKRKSVLIDDVNAVKGKVTIVPTLVDRENSYAAPESEGDDPEWDIYYGI